MDREKKAYFSLVLRSGAFIALGACESVCVRLKANMSAISTGRNFLSITESDRTWDKLASRANQSIGIPFPACTLPDSIDILRWRLQIIANDDATSRMGFDTTCFGQLVTWLDADCVYYQIRFKSGSILQNESSKDFFRRAILRWSTELFNRSTIGQDLDAHGLNFAQNHFSSISVKLTRKRKSLSVDDSHVGNSFMGVRRSISKFRWLPIIRLT